MENMEKIEKVETTETNVSFLNKVKNYLEKNEIARLVAVLSLITSVIGLLLAGVNAFTAPVIYQREQAATIEAMQTYIPEADKFKERDVDTELNPIVLSFFEAESNKEVIGHVVKVAPSGYGGPIEMIVAFDLNGSIIGTSVITMSETSNIGTKVTEESFSTQFIGSKSGDNKEYDTISGATTSSTAYILGVNTAIDYLATNK